MWPHPELVEGRSVFNGFRSWFDKLLCECQVMEPLVLCHFDVTAPLPLRETCCYSWPGSKTVTLCLESYNQKLWISGMKKAAYPSGC